MLRIGLVALLILMPLGSSASEPVEWFLQRGTQLSSEAPNGEAVGFTYSVQAPHEVTFQGTPLATPLGAPNGISAVLWFTSTYAVSSHVTATLTVGGDSWHSSRNVVVNTDREPIDFHLIGPTTIPAGEALDFTVRLHGFMSSTGDIPVDPFTWNVTLLYDGHATPSHLMIGQEATEAPPMGSEPPRQITHHLIIGSTAIVLLTIALASRRPL